MGLKGFLNSHSSTKNFKRRAASLVPVSSPSNVTLRLKTASA